MTHNDTYQPTTTFTTHVKDVGDISFKLNVDYFIQLSV